jgi:hypothetical protein
MPALPRAYKRHADASPLAKAGPFLPPPREKGGSAAGADG